MKNLRQFVKFDPSFFNNLKLMYVQQSPWMDNDTGSILGTKVEVVILEDNNNYRQPKDGSEPKTNRFEKMTVKVAKPVSLSNDAEVQLVNPVATVYGDYQNQLSVKAEDVVPVTTTATKATPTAKLTKTA